MYHSKRFESDDSGLRLVGLYKEVYIASTTNNIGKNYAYVTWGVLKDWCFPLYPLPPSAFTLYPQLFYITYLQCRWRRVSHYSGWKPGTLKLHQINRRYEKTIMMINQLMTGGYWPDTGAHKAYERKRRDRWYGW